MNSEKFFKDFRLPFVECRFSESSTRIYKEHMHKTFCVGAVADGLIQFQISSENVILSKGSLALINPETLHSCNACDAEGRSYFMLYLDLDWCIAVQKSLWQTSSFVPAKEPKLDHHRLYARYCSVMKKLMNPEIHLLEKEQSLVFFAASLFRVCCQPQGRKKKGLESIEHLRKVLGENLREDLTLDSLAQQLGANPYTLLRRFKAVTGITPHAYRTNCRIEHARILLQQGVDIAETAMECGFFDQSHLHRHFKAMTTVTPQEYRVNFIQ